MADLDAIRDERLPVEQAFRRYHDGLTSFLRQRSEEEAADVARKAARGWCRAIGTRAFCDGHWID